LFTPLPATSLWQFWPIPLFSLLLLCVAVHQAAAVYWPSTRLPHQLAAAIETYAETWEFLAVEDPTQLLAALQQVKHLLDSVTAVLSLPASHTEHQAAMTQAVRTLDFLHLAHKNLVSDFGATPLIATLISSVRMTRELLLQVRCPVHSAVFSAAGLVPHALLLINLLLCLPMELGNLYLEFVLAAVMFLLAAAALALNHLSSPFSGWMHISIEALTYVRARISDKERDVAVLLRMA
jgi:hypothetical protein